MSNRDPSVSAGESVSDGELEQLFHEAREAADPTDLDALFEATLQAREADRGVSGWLRSRPTWLRRLIATSAVFTMLGAIAIFEPRHDLAEIGIAALLPPALALGVLVLVSIWVALRPMQAPTLSRAKVASLLGICVASAIVVAIYPADEVATGGALAVWPCFGLGLLVGLPVYALTRLLDRGSRISAVLAAGAAGLAGNLALEVKCAMDGAAHGLGGHASVLVLFVLGALAAFWVEGRLLQGHDR